MFAKHTAPAQPITTVRTASVLSSHIPAVMRGVFTQSGLCAMMAAIVALHRGVCDSLGRSLGRAAWLDAGQSGGARLGTGHNHRRTRRPDVEKVGSQRVCTTAKQGPGICASDGSPFRPVLSRPRNMLSS